jgi:hypothetical protein
VRRSFLSLCHHDFGNYVQNFIVATAAARRAMGNSLNVLENFQNVFHFIVMLERALDIRVANLFTIANDIVFHKFSP